MASFLRPRRGKNSTAKNTLTSSNPLKRGEIFFEVPDGGVGTGQGRLFMGDGSTAYSSLNPFLSIPDATIPSFDIAAQDTDAKRLTKIATGVKFKELFCNLKALLTSFDSRITSLNNEKADKHNIGIYNPVDNFGVYAIFSNSAWGACTAIIWMPHGSSLTYSLIQVAALGDGNLTTDVTNNCTLDTNRTQYFVIACKDTSVAHKLASIHIKAVKK